MKNPYFSAKPASAKLEGLPNLLESFNLAGSNIGNLLFSSAIRRVIAHENTCSSISFKFNPYKVREQNDGIVIAAANWLNSNSDFGGLAAILETSKLPLLALGLGAQSFDGSIPKLTEGTLKLINVLSAQSNSISVRGAFTAEVLAHYGIKNVVVTGCPSLLWHKRPAYAEKSNQSPINFSLNGTRSDTDKSLFKSDNYKIGLFLTRYAYQHGLDYVAQTEFSDIIVSSNDVPIEESEKSQALSYLSRVYNTDNLEKLEQYLKQHIKYFWDIPDWLNYSSNIDMTLGTRLHGIIAALLSGKPAMLVIHDSRTREMATQAAIPYIEAHDILANKYFNLTDLYQDINIEQFNNRQKNYYEDYRHFFDENNVAHHLKEVT